MCARVLSLLITPLLCVQQTAPDSKPGLASRLPLEGGGGGGVVVQQVVPATLMAEKAAATPAHWVLVAPYRSVAALTAAVRAPA